MCLNLIINITDDVAQEFTLMQKEELFNLPHTISAMIDSFNLLKAGIGLKEIKDTDLCSIKTDEYEKFFSDLKIILAVHLTAETPLSILKERYGLNDKNNEREIYKIVFSELTKQFQDNVNRIKKMPDRIGRIIEIDETEGLKSKVNRHVIPINNALNFVKSVMDSHEQYLQNELSSIDFENFYKIYSELLINICKIFTQ